MPLQSAQQLTACGVPQPHRLVHAPRGQGALIRGEGHAQHRGRCFNETHFSKRIGVVHPDADRRRHCQQLAIRRPSYLIDPPFTPTDQLYHPLGIGWVDDGQRGERRYGARGCRLGRHGGRCTGRRGRGCGRVGRRPSGHGCRSAHRCGHCFGRLGKVAMRQCLRSGFYIDSGRWRAWCLQRRFDRLQRRCLCRPLGRGTHARRRDAAHQAHSYDHCRNQQSDLCYACHGTSSLLAFSTGLGGLPNFR